jgi:hypothetical protein
MLHPLKNIITHHQNNHHKPAVMFLVQNLFKADFKHRSSFQNTELYFNEKLLWKEIPSGLLHQKKQ